MEFGVIFHCLIVAEEGKLLIDILYFFVEVTRESFGILLSCCNFEFTFDFACNSLCFVCNSFCIC